MKPSPLVDILMISTQCVAAEKKSNSILWIIRKRVENKTVNVIMALYIFIVQPHPEYSVPFWSLQLIKDTVEMEKVLVALCQELESGAGQQ